MVQVELSKIIIDEKRQDQIIVLKEKEGERQFPIVIGFLEASSIKMRLSGAAMTRPNSSRARKSTTVTIRPRRLRMPTT